MIKAGHALNFSITVCSQLRKSSLAISMNRKILSQMMLCFLVDLLLVLPPYSVSSPNSAEGLEAALLFLIFYPVPDPFTLAGPRAGELLRARCLQGWFVIHLWSIPALCAPGQRSHSSSLHPELLLPQPLQKAKGQWRGAHLQLPVNCLFGAAVKRLHIIFIN